VAGESLLLVGAESSSSSSQSSLLPAKCATLDLATVTAADLETLEFTAEFNFPQDYERRLMTSLSSPSSRPAIHGFVLWFSVFACGSPEARAAFVARSSDDAAATTTTTQLPIELATGPRDAPTHWKQTVLMVSDDGIPAADVAGETMRAKFTLQRDQRSYQIEMELE
jgi:hypothetical protein